MRENGNTAARQRQDNRDIPRAAAPCRGFSFGFPTIYFPTLTLTILIFEPLLEPYIRSDC